MFSSHGGHLTNAMYHHADEHAHMHVGCTRRVHKMVYLAVKKGNILVNILFLTYSLPIIVTYKSNCESA